MLDHKRFGTEASLLFIMLENMYDLGVNIDCLDEGQAAKGS